MVPEEFKSGVELVRPEGDPFSSGDHQKVILLLCCTVWLDTPPVPLSSTGKDGMAYPHS